VRTRSAAQLGAAAVAVWMLHSGVALELPILCVLRRVTGLPCPSCGMTRAMAAMVHGDWRRAIAYNMGSWLTALLAFVGILLLGAEVVTGRELIARVWQRRSIRRTVAAVVVVVMAVAWGVNLRNAIHSGWGEERPIAESPR
jgi:hypothetical protein